METETPEVPQTGLWNKKQTDMTVGDGMKLGVIAIVVSTVAPIAVFGAVAGVSALCRKIKSRKSKDKTESPEIPKETPKGK